MQSTSDVSLSLLELLAVEAPTSRIDAVRRRVSAADGSCPSELQSAERGIQLARAIQANVARSDRRASAMTALLDTARDLTALDDVGSVLQLIVRRARLLLNLNLAHIRLNDDAGSCASDGSTTPLDAGEALLRCDRLGLSGHDPGVPQWTADYHRDKRIEHPAAVTELIDREGVHAIVAVRVRHGDIEIGTLYGADRKVRHYTPDELNVLCCLADIAAMAIDKAEATERARSKLAHSRRKNSLLSASLERLCSADEARSRLLDLVLSGADAAGLVLIRDSLGSTVAVSGVLPQQDDLAVARACLEAHTSQGVTVIGDSMWVAPVVADSQYCGVVLVAPRGELSDEGRRVVRVISQVVAVFFLVRRRDASAHGPVREQLLDELLAGTGLAPHRLAYRTRASAVELSAPHVLVIARLENVEQNRAAAWAASYARRYSGLHTVHDRDIVLLLPGKDPSAAAKAVSAELTRLLGVLVSVGAGGPGRGAADAGRMYLEARRCLDALKSLGNDGCAASAEDLGFIGVLLSDQHDAEGFIRSVLGPVIDHDDERLTDLIPTLEAYFSSGGSPTNAGAALHVHPNTVSRRLERVTTLLGLDWQKPSPSLEIQLALRLRRTRAVLHQQQEGATRPLTA